MLIVIYTKFTDTHTRRSHNVANLFAISKSLRSNFC